MFVELFSEWVLAVSDLFDAVPSSRRRSVASELRSFGAVLLLWSGGLLKRSFEGIVDPRLRRSALLSH